MSSTAALLWRGYTPPSNGIAGGYTGDNINVQRAMIAFSAIAWYNSVELIFLICIRFKKWKGLYFWSLIVTSWAIIVYQIGSYGKMTHIYDSHPALMTTLTNIGWIVMVTGESLVLYSRLHLLSQNRTLLRCMLWGILINSFCCYLPTTVLDYSANIVHPDQHVYVVGYSVMERIQMTLLTIQEIAISAIYLVECYRFLNITYIGDKRSRNIMWELFAINVVIICLDIALLTVAQLNFFAIEVTLKGLVYSTKLKLELGVLSRLVQIVSRGGSGLQHTATFDNDLANMSNDDKALGGLDFCTSPFQTDSKIEKGNTSSETTLTSSPPPPANRDRRAGNSVPWLATTVRVRSHRSENQSPLRPPAVFRPSEHTIQRGESYANTEFLTSAAVSEGANDENIRQFQQEIAAELGDTKVRPNMTTVMHRSLPSCDSAPGISLHRITTRPDEGNVSPTTVKEDDEKSDWADQLSSFGLKDARPRPNMSRQSSIRDLYPGLITGEKG
ncbi:hypothetical protein K461DRAFT_162301 [Myriangium duriaei CBS 260.36]|uniref:DUF7703 domain-containing protein n=1 Tax=Myriangium duriaei CBS 260.36 TaxID=1168546 RepID=A0A9P4J291_9PEZI|nr:hypothetical protein K461DRAFT_162301 [Myriangium duriaei CBS 260.36]